MRCYPLNIHNQKHLSHLTVARFFEIWCSNKRIQIFGFVFLLFTGQTFALNPLKAFVDNNLHKSANISILVEDLNKGKIVSAFRPENVAVPASTLKLVTTATALELLGPDYQFQTKLEIDGKISTDSILTGNLYVFGTGDPTLGSSKIGNKNFLDDWAKAVKKAGIKQIEGNIIADASAYDRECVNPKWLWEDLGNYYASGTYGLSYKDDMFEMQLSSGEVGSVTQIVKVMPFISDLIFTNFLKTTTISYDSASINGAPYSNERELRGELPANRKNVVLNGDIPCPGLVLVRDFAEKLRVNGVQVTGSAVDEVPFAKRTVIYTHFSPNLSEIIRETNQSSNNQFAEHIFRHLAWKTNGDMASSRDAVTVIKNFWHSRGLPTEELVMYDGSGLSPQDAISANFLVELLRYMDQSVYRDAFRASLPTAGISGTLKNFLKGTTLEGKVQAKSGTMNRVKCYAGYLQNRKKNYVFAILVNNYNSNSSAETTKRIEEFLLKIAK